jgi:Rod binding domain-containing protein
VSIDAFNPAAMMATQSLSNPADLKNKEMGEAAEQFEGYMVEMMVREMRKTVPEGMFSSSAVDMFAGVLDQEISKSIAASGGLGFARMLGQQSSSRSMSQGQPMPAHDSAR